MSHPNAIRLEAFALGERDRETEVHVSACEACRAYVARIGGVSEPIDPARAAAVVAKASEGAQVTPIAKRSEPVVRLRTIAFVAVPFAAAAAILVGVAQPPSPTAAPPASEVARAPSATAPEPERLLMASNEPKTRFKGGLSVAVVRERGGEQARFTRSVAVKSGDRLRVEVALDRSDAILAAVLGEDGSWLELMPEGVRDAGTHFSERSARVDAAPTAGVILVGHPEDVRRARATRDMRGVVTFPVDVESP